MIKENPSGYGKKGMKEMLYPETESWYCPNCSTAEKINTTINNKTGDRLLQCNDCGIVIRFYIQSKATKTVAEAAKSFEATPLTDSQRGHKIRKIRKPRQIKKRTKKK